MSNVQCYSTIAWSAGPGCHGGCGQELYVKDGELVRVEGDENNPFNQGRSCPRVLALKQYMYHPDRIIHPLKRVGKRGEGKFERISWDEAYDFCEARLGAIREEYGAESVVFGQGTGRDIGGPMSFLAYSFGSPNWCQLGLSGQSCYTPRLGAMKAVMGDFAVADCSQYLEKRYEDPEYKVPEVIIVWGTNPTSGCPDAFMGHWIVDCMQRGSKIITVDPRNTWMTTRSAHHLQLRPGTSGALALGMLNVVINENMYDQDFVEKWTQGFDDLKERVQEYTPARVAEITGVAEDDIIAASRLYAGSKRAAVHWGVTIDMEPESTAIAQAIISLWSITGNIDIPGGEVIARPSFGVTAYPYTSEELADLYGEDMVKRLNAKRIGADKYPMVKNFRGWAQPDMAIEQMNDGQPYPIKGLWLQTANVLGGQAARPRLHYEAMKKMDFIAVVDLFHNPTTMALADIVLPAATFPEKNSFRAWWAPLSVITKRVQVGECKSDWEINFELAKRFNPEGLKKWDKVEDLFDERMAPAGVTFEQLKEEGGWKMPPDGPSKPYFRHERGLLRPDGQPGFNTESGKVELYCDTYKSWDLDPLPYYTEPAQSPVSTPELYKKYPLIMITGARSPLFFHSEHRNIPWLREKAKDPIVEINPQTAEKFGIYDGEWIYIKNDLGRVKRKACITKQVKPGEIQTLHGWWMPEMKKTEPDLFGVWDYQINQLIPGPQHSKAGFGGGQYKTTLVTLEKFSEGGK